MTTLYKLTDKNGRTHHDTQWGEGVSHSGTGRGPLCAAGYIHAYEHPLIAVFMNPVHADFPQPLLWEAEGEIALRDGHLKCGCVTLTTIRELPLPVLTTDQRVRIARECVRWAKALGVEPGTDPGAEAVRWAVLALKFAKADAIAEAEAVSAGHVLWFKPQCAAWAATAAHWSGTAGAPNVELPLLTIIQQVLG